MKVTEDYGEEIPRKRKRSKLSKQDLADQWYDNNYGNQIDWSSKENRARFRETRYWKNFSKRSKHHTCEFCTCQSKNTQMHHTDPKNYDDLTRSKFKELCYSCHTKIQQLSRRKNRGTVPDYFLPFLEN